MSGLLALVGGAPFTDGCTFDRSLIEHAAAESVAILPTAAAYEKPDQVVAEAVAYFATLGIPAQAVDVLARPDALDSANADAVRAARCCYLVGGSAMHAKSVLIHSPVWEALIAAWNDGASVVGAGAGGQILCDPMVDDRGGALTVGLGLLRDVAIIPARNTLSEEALHRTRALSPPDLALLAVDEATAAIRSPDGSWHSEGRGVVELHVGGEPADLASLRR